MANLSEIITSVGEYTHPDGNVYPPVVHTVEGIPGGEFTKVPRSERPAFIWRLPATHTVRLDTSSAEVDARYAESGFLIHFLALLVGFRMQFHDWWIDGRGDLQGTTDYWPPNERQLSVACKRALGVWRAWPDKSKRIATNALYLHSRIDAYEAEWERFQIAFQVVDVTYRIAVDIGRIPPRRVPRRHADRLALLCDQLGLATNSDKCDRLVELRNGLLHEALWDGGMPGAVVTQDAFYSSRWLEKLGRRALFAVLGLGGAYIASP